MTTVTAMTTDDDLTIVRRLLSRRRRGEYVHPSATGHVSVPPPGLRDGRTRAGWRALTDAEREAILDKVAPIGTNPATLIGRAARTPPPPPRTPTPAPTTPPTPAPTAPPADQLPPGVHARSVIACACGAWVPARGHRPRFVRCVACETQANPEGNPLTD